MRFGCAFAEGSHRTNIGTPLFQWCLLKTYTGYAIGLEPQLYSQGHVHVFKALFDYSESETSLLNPTVLSQTSPTVNANPTSDDRFESGTGLAQTGSRFMCNQTCLKQ